MQGLPATTCVHEVTRQQTHTHTHTHAHTHTHTHIFRALQVPYTWNKVDLFNKEVLT